MHSVVPGKLGILPQVPTFIIPALNPVFLLAWSHFKGDFNSDGGCVKGKHGLQKPSANTGRYDTGQL